jgi:hypothetical protein
MKLILTLLVALTLGAALKLTLDSHDSTRHPQIEALDGGEPQAERALTESDEGTGLPDAALEDPEVAPSSVRTHAAPSSDREKAASDHGAPVPVTIEALAVKGLTDYRGPPLAGATVGLFHRDSPEELMGTARTDADGMATINAPKGLLAPNERGFTQVAARVVDPGYVLRSSSVRRKGEAEEASYQVKLLAVRGWTQPVQVVGALDPDAARPVRVMGFSKPKFHIVGVSPTSPSLQADSRSSVRRLGDGLFECQIVEGTEPRWIVVNGGAGGVASAELPQRPDGNAEAEPMKLELQGPAELKGAVLGTGDSAALPFHLVASLRPSGSAARFDGDEEPLRSELLIAGEGQFRAEATTAADGTFSFKGLMPGRYEFTTEVQGKSGEYHGAREFEVVTLGFAEATADPVPVVLRHSRPTILVKMTAGKAGAPVGLVLFEAGTIGEPPWVKPKSRGWDRPTAKPLDTRGAPFASAQGGHLTAHFDVEAGAQYLLVAKWADFSRRVELVEVPISKPEVTVVIEESDQPSSELRVEAVLAEFDPIQLARLRAGPETGVASAEPAANRISMSRTLAITLEDPATGLPIQYGELKDGARGFTCPVGPVRVVAMGQPYIESHHGTLVAPRAHGRSEKIVDVKAGRVTRVQLEVPIGGVLHVEVAGALSKLDITRRHEEVARRRQTGDYVRAEDVEWMLHAKLFIENSTHHVYEAVPREAFTGRNSSAAGIHLINEWPLGETHSSTILPPGTYTLRASFPGRQPIETRVSIREGSVTKVGLDFGR